jgi:hypothetical protein
MIIHRRTSTPTLSTSSAPIRPLSRPSTGLEVIRRSSAASVLSSPSFVASTRKGLHYLFTHFFIVPSSIGSRHDSILSSSSANLVDRGITFGEPCQTCTGKHTFHVNLESGQATSTTVAPLSPRFRREQQLHWLEPFLMARFRLLGWFPFGGLLSSMITLCIRQLNFSLTL